MSRKLTIAVPALLLLTGTVAILWSGLNLVPIRFLFRYGLTPGCEPTGEVIEVQDIEFVVIGPGVCRMGSGAMLNHSGDDWWSQQGFTKGSVVGRFCRPIGVPWGESPKPSDEMPVHYVEFPDGFAIATTEVTNAQYRRYLEANPGAGRPAYWDDEDFNRPRQPVVGIGWDEAKAYCAWLAKESKRPVRLPSESEWEASCRAGSVNEYGFGDDESDLAEYAWYSENAGDRTHDVATRKANAWGLFDLHGNVWEWCEDTWHDAYRLTRTVTGPDGRPRTETVAKAPSDGAAWVDGGAPLRVIRGGSWRDPAVLCRSAYRTWHDPSYRDSYLGFRPALGPSDP